MKTALSIAGSDCSGGAGIQADLKTMTMNGVYGMSVITALTAQNTMGVRGIEVVAPAFLQSQLEAVFEDIVPDAVKIGMLPGTEQIQVLAECLTRYAAKNIVADPVMVSTSGRRLMEPEAVEAWKTYIFPLATLITPNIPEAEVLWGRRITNEGEMLQAAQHIGSQGKCSVLLKGGHRVSDANDLLWKDGTIQWFRGERIENPNTHGTGCTLSSAIAANLAKGYSLEQSIARAKAYISEALNAMLDLGKGNGPMHHGFALSGIYTQENEIS